MDDLGVIAINLLTKRLDTCVFYSSLEGVTCVPIWFSVIIQRLH
jgi:hypothetical protein